MKVTRTQPHMAARGLRIGIGHGVHENGVMDALVLGFEDWSPTTTKLGEDDKVMVVVVPIDIPRLRALGDTCMQIADFLETGKEPDLREPME